MTLSQARIHEFQDFARHLAALSGEIILEYFGSPDLLVEEKADCSPVTLADRKAEEIIRHEITKRYPEHGIIGEEFGSENETADFVWVLDPIDGTISFTAGCPLFGTLICLQYQGKPVVGLIHQPVVNQLVLGSPLGTTCNGRSVKVSDVTSLGDSLLLTTDISNIYKFQSGDSFEKLRDQTKIFRTWGDCYGYVLVALGGAQIMLDPIMNPWDLKALIPIVTGAGGVITAWDGSDAVDADSCVASVPGLHEQVIEILNS